VSRVTHCRSRRDLLRRLAAGGLIIGGGTPSRLTALLLLVVTYLRAGEQWRALDALVNRVYGKPKETVVSEQAEPEWKRQMNDLSTDALTRIVHKNNPEVIRRMEEDGTIKACRRHDR
jgi:hypothetical protein